MSRLVDPADVTAALELGEDASAVVRRRLLRHNGDPIELSWSYYPSAIVAGTSLAEPGKISGGAPVALANLGVAQQRFVDRISARPPTTFELELLELPQGVSVLRQFRTVYATGDRPVEVSILVKGGHLHELAYGQQID